MLEGSSDTDGDQAPQSHPAFEFGASVFEGCGLSTYSANLLGLSVCSGEDYLHTYIGADWTDRRDQVRVTERIEALTDCCYVDCYGISEDDLVGEYPGGDDDDPSPGIIDGCENTLLLDNVDEIRSAFQSLYEPMTSQQYTAYDAGERTRVDTPCTVLAVNQLEEPAESYSDYREMLPFNQKEMSLFDLVILPTIGPNAMGEVDDIDLDRATERVATANDIDPTLPEESAGLIDRVEQAVEGDTVSRRYADLTLLARAAARLRHSDTVDAIDVRAASKLLYDTDILGDDAAGDPDVILTGANQPDLNRHQFTLQVIETVQEDYFFGVPFEDLTVVMEDYLIDEEELESTLETLKDKGDVLKHKDRYRAAN